MTKGEAICELYGLIADINEEEVADHIKSGVSLQDWTNAWRCRAKDVLRVLEDTADTPQTEKRIDRDGDVWEWRGDAWYCIGQSDTPQTDCAWMYDSRRDYEYDKALDELERNE